MDTESHVDKYFSLNQLYLSFHKLLPECGSVLAFCAFSEHGWCSLPRLVKNLKSVVRLPYVDIQYSIKFLCLTFAVWVLTSLRRNAMRSASQCPCSLLTTAPHSACLPESPAECTSRTLLSLSLREAAQPSSFLTANSCQNTASLPRHLSWCGSPRVSSHLTVPCLEDSRQFSLNI